MFPIKSKNKLILKLQTNKKDAFETIWMKYFHSNEIFLSLKEKNIDVCVKILKEQFCRKKHDIFQIPVCYSLRLSI